MSCYGADTCKTPNVDELARGGIRFDRAFTAPLCGPSRALILTGRYAFRTGATNQDAVRDADLVVLAVKADGALDTARDVADALGETPLLSVATAIRFEKGVGMLPDPDALSLAERVQAIVGAPVAAGLHSIAASNLEDAPPDEDALICSDDERASTALSIFMSQPRKLDRRW